MASLNPMSWDLDFFLLSSRNDAMTKMRRNGRIVLTAIYLTVAVLARFWLGQVMKHVPEPYLDEVFHIPQAQAYCRGELDVWDPKLTTPPGLYIVSAFLIKFLQWGSCTVQELRTVDFLALMSLLFVAQGCRSRITCQELRYKNRVQKKDMKFKPGSGQDINWDAVHTAVNICLFPPLFFFSGLYYTDVLSTCVVLGAYYHFLKLEEAGSPRSGEDRADASPPSSFSRGLTTYLIGLASLLMRQTNVFWTAIFMAGMEAVRCFRSELAPFRRKDKQKPMAYIKAFIQTCSSGIIDDPTLAEARGLDIFWCTLSLALATLLHPRMLLVRLWPYVALLVSFGLFVLWNGGVVLGDKSNHVATIHLCQMLYIWPFMLFFSVPFIPQILLDLLGRLLPTSFRRVAFSPRPNRGLQLSTGAWLIGSLAVSVTFVHFNTIIHPFTLADNRHYVFYVFRYTIRRHPLVRYALAPIYVLCGCLVFLCLAGTRDSQLDEAAATEKGSNAKQEKVVSRQTPELTQSFQPKTSFALVWFMSTALSLITAPLVEPRYFIIPWVIWRLHVPNIVLGEKEAKMQSKTSTKGAKNTSIVSWAEWAKYWAYKGHDHRLWIETLWYLFISTVTGFIFLFNGFEWPQEPEKVQRFMW